MGHRSSFSIKLSFGIGHPPAIYQMQCLCVGEGSRVPNRQMEFNYLDSFKSYGIFSDFVVPVVPTLSPWSPHCPHHLHSPQKVPIWSPLLWSLWSPPYVVPIVLIVPTSSLSSPCRPCCPHIVPIPPEGPHVVPMAVVSVVSMVSTLCCPHCPCHPHVVPIIPTLSPHHLEGSHIIHNPPDTQSTHPHPPGCGGP